MLHRMRKRKFNYCHDKKFVVTFELGLYNVHKKKNMYVRFANASKQLNFFLKK